MRPQVREKPSKGDKSISTRSLTDSLAMSKGRRTISRAMAIIRERESLTLSPLIGVDSDNYFKDLAE
jgi:hypothetical protein